METILLNNLLKEIIKPVDEAINDKKYEGLKKNLESNKNEMERMIKDMNLPNIDPEEEQKLIDKMKAEV